MPDAGFQRQASRRFNTRPPDHRTAHCPAARAFPRAASSIASSSGFVNTFTDNVHQMDKIRRLLFALYPLSLLTPQVGWAFWIFTKEYEHLVSGRQPAPTFIGV
jgi:hypothetical protein